MFDDLEVFNLSWLKGSKGWCVVAIVVAMSWPCDFGVGAGWHVCVCALSVSCEGGFRLNRVVVVLCMIVCLGGISMCLTSELAESSQKESFFFWVELWSSLQDGVPQDPKSVNFKKGTRRLSQSAEQVGCVHSPIAFIKVMESLVVSEGE